jgi:RNA polymerase sigma-70 factor (ECF subfamily)
MGPRLPRQNHRVSETFFEQSLDPDLASAQAGDDQAFDRLVAPLRRELHAHCYRMLGSVHDADDALQEALIRAWRNLGTFAGRGTLRGWLYTVATRTCLDSVARRERRALPMDLGPSSSVAVLDDQPLTEIAWLGPYPDAGLADAFEQREAVELAFVAALQHLPGNQRAALLMFEVLDFSAAEIAEVMDTSTASVNSALQRARKLIAERVPARSQQQTLRQLADAKLKEIVNGFARALERGDADAFVALVSEDVTWSMPPLGTWYRGVDAVLEFATKVPFVCGSWKHVPVSANGQPAIACYLQPLGETGPHGAWSIDVLTLREGKIAEVTSFIGPEHFAPFGLPETR